MAGTIGPLPIMLADQQRIDEQAPGGSERVLVRYGYTRMIAELTYDGAERPLGGDKLVIRTSRGIELAELLAGGCGGQGCGGQGCGVAPSRKQVLQFIDNSGGRDYPFVDHGKVLRIASRADLNEQTQIDQAKPRMFQFMREVARELDLPVKLVDIELLLGGERVLFHYTSEQWVDFRDLVRRLAQEYQTRIEMHQVNAREEARLVGDYEKCGQHCCCRQFLKVLRPVSMKSAKVQKATLDPSKISGRCGRLMCCLRYEDNTYEQLRKRLPHRQTRVKTEDGVGTVVNTHILTQLVVVRLDDANLQRAFPLDEIEPVAPADDPRNKSGADKDKSAGSVQGRARKARPTPPARSTRKSTADRQEGSEPDPGGQDQGVEPEGESATPAAEAPQQDESSVAPDSAAGKPEGKPKRRRRRRRGKRPS